MNSSILFWLPWICKGSLIDVASPAGILRGIAVGWVNPDEVGCLTVVWSGVCRFLLSPSFGGSLDKLILSFMLLATAGSVGAIGVVVVVGLCAFGGVVKIFPARAPGRMVELQSGFLG